MQIVCLATIRWLMADWGPEMLGKCIVVLSTLTLMLAVGASHGLATADDWIVRDESGARVETIEEGYGDLLVRRDAAGRRIGTIEPGYGGNWIIRDEAGRRVGEVTEGYGGRLSVRDSSGSVLYRLDESWGGDLIIRDTSGRRVGTAEPW